jgi:hypothetical protein
MRNIKVFRSKEGIPELILNAPINSKSIGVINEVPNTILADIINGGQIDIQVTDQAGNIFLLEFNKHTLKRTQIKTV